MTSNLVHNNNRSGNKQIVAFKELIQEALYPEEPMHYSYGSMAIAQRIFRTYETSGGDNTGLIDLKLFFVECGTQFTLDCGDIDEDFYTALEDAFQDALKVIKKTGTLNVFKDRLRMIIQESQDTGYGYGDQLQDLMEMELSDFLETTE